MKIKSIKPAPSGEVWDLKACGTSNFALATNSIESLIVHNCDTTCLGKTCGTCDAEDLKKRRQYIVEAQSEVDIDLSQITPIDNKSLAMKVRARIYKPATYRFVQNDHWRFNVRRAAYRAEKAIKLLTCTAPRQVRTTTMPCEKCETCKQFGGITKRSIRFASDSIKFKDWTCGYDYLEFGMLKRISQAQVQQFVDYMNVELCATVGDESTRWLGIREWTLHPAASASMRTDVDLSLWELEIADEPSKVLRKLTEWHESDYVKMILKQEAAYFNAGAEEFNGKDFVEDVWLVRSGAKLMLRMLLRGRPSPYNVYASVMGRSSWIEAAKVPAFKVDSFVDFDRNQGDFFRLNCEDCGKVIPSNVMDEPYDPLFCPHCKDRADATAVDTLTFA